MSNNTDPTSPAELASLPERAGRLGLLGPPPLIEGEDTAIYDELLAQISACVKPVDILEDIWVRDIVDLVWEAFRLRRLKASLMTASAYKGLAVVLRPLLGRIEADRLAQEWAARKRRAVEKVDAALASAGLTMDAVMALTLSEKLDDIERIDRMIATAELRRIAVLREIDRHRATLGEALRRAAQQIEDAEFERVEEKQSAERDAA